MSLRGLGLAAALVLATGALGVTPISQAEQIGVRSGQMIGAAAGCGVAEPRLVAAGRATLDLMRDAARSPDEAERARRLHERTVAETAARMRDRQEECPSAIAAFERAERN